MADRENVIKALECCERTDGDQCKNCTYTDSGICVEEMSKDALELLKEQQSNIEYWSTKYDEMGKQYMAIRDERDELLKEQEKQKFFVDENGKITPLPVVKEQETVKPKKIKGFNQPCYVHYAFICENCKTDLIQGQPYCAGCGRPVKWEC